MVPNGLEKVAKFDVRNFSACNASLAMPLLVFASLELAERERMWHF
jgi:hypothetical protein